MESCGSLQHQQRRFQLDSRNTVCVSALMLLLFAFLRAVSFFVPLVPELYSLPCLISLLGKRLPSVGPAFGRTLRSVIINA
jgi:hypothetical protein